MTFAFAIFSALSALTNWWSVAISRRRVEYVAKPLTMLLMAVAAVFAGMLGSTAGVWFAAGMALGLFGDIALLGRKEAHFMAGLGSFLLGHIAYLVSLSMLLAPKWQMAAIAAGIVVLAVLLMRKALTKLWKDFGAGLGISCIVYATTIALMVLLAWLTGSWICGIGASIFMASDSLLSSGIARRGFESDSPRERTIVMITYHVGQGLLAAGIIALTV
ncbi:membrane protein [Glutamicibacter uratoxydans]|uniref:Membrane protein n=1 Tax=Glutamicibacter uratoxydans TaxID=43667 RepID=A0A4Y4DNT3_GLUUR|nr:lysoplasmalogenase [Glutamicibacter uratoxydans]GED06586.1 membrane protein [Glutamicibacter uratoxydans]